MSSEEHDKEMAHFAMHNANMWVTREILQYLVEEGLMDGAKAAQIVRTAADESMPAEKSTGARYDMGRRYLLALEKAFRSFPPYPDSNGGGGSPRRDR